MPRFRIQAVISLDPDRFKFIDDPDGAVRDDADAALATFADDVETVVVEEVAG